MLSLDKAAQLWFLIAVIGQWIFAYYIFTFYGGAAAAGNMQAWNDRLFHGLMEGDLIGNIVVASHLLLAFVITVGGPLQIIPQIRDRLPDLHRWNGRVYIFTAAIISLGGLYMVWTRGVAGGTINAIAISTNAVLILLCAAMTVRYAMAMNFDTHRRWALRTFLVVSGVWFARVGYGFWILLNNGAPGSTEELTGPFDHSIAFLSYLFPLAVLELYLRMKEGGGTIGRFTTAILLLILTVITGVGIVGAFLIFWKPLL